MKMLLQSVIPFTKEKFVNSKKSLLVKIVVPIIVPFITRLKMLIFSPSLPGKAIS